MDWTVGPVQDTMDDQTNFSGSGFNIRARAGGGPLLTFGYLSRSEAETARALIIQALENVKYVGPPR